MARASPWPVRRAPAPAATCGRRATWRGVCGRRGCRGRGRERGRKQGPWRALRRSVVLARYCSRPPLVQPDERSVAPPRGAPATSGPLLCPTSAGDERYVARPTQRLRRAVRCSAPRGLRRAAGCTSWRSKEQGRPASPREARIRSLRLHRRGTQVAVRLVAPQGGSFNSGGRGCGRVGPFCGWCGRGPFAHVVVPCASLSPTRRASRRCRARPPPGPPRVPGSP